MSKSDKPYEIRIEGYRLYAYHGVLPEENKLGQEFEIDLLLTLNQPISPHLDDVENVVSYWDVMRTVNDVFTGNVYKLMETAALAILDSLRVYPEIRAAKVTVKKLTPPVPANVKTVGVVFEETY